MTERQQRTIDFLNWLTSKGDRLTIQGPKHELHWNNQPDGQLKVQASAKIWLESQGQDATAAEVFTLAGDSYGVVLQQGSYPAWA